MPECRDGVHENIMGKFSSWLNNPDPENSLDNRIKHFTKANWYDVPAVFKILAPTNESLVKAEYNPLRFYLQNSLKGLPHSVIMLPWKTFQLAQCAPELKDEFAVSFGA